MTEKEKIRAEIERQIPRHVCGYKNALKDILKFINSLPEEPVSKDLEEEINRYIDPLTPADIQENPFTSLEKCARHFANWQKEQMMKDAVDAGVTDIRTYKEENEVNFTIMLEKGAIPYEIEEEVKLIIIKEAEK